MKILVTGSSGFLASNVIYKLINKKKNFVYGVDKKKNKFFKNKRNFKEFIMDLSKKKNVNKLFKLLNNKIDIVFHSSAVQPIKKDDDFKKYLDGNFISTINILDACRINNIKKIVFSSSFSVYGKQKNPITEKHKLEPANFYGLSKKLAEKILEYYSRVHNFKVITLRFDGIYGNRQNLPGFIITLSEFMKQNKNIEIFNNGKLVRDYIYVNDASNAVCLAINNINNVNYRVYNIGGGQPNTSYLVANKVQKILKSKSKILISNKGNPLRNHNIYMNIKKAQNELKFKPKNLEENLKTMLI